MGTPITTGRTPPGLRFCFVLTKRGDLLPNRSTGGTLVYGVRVGGVVTALYQPEGPAHLS
jgi:hypothetical protein